jgi:hypothetical protein
MCDVEPPFYDAGTGRAACHLHALADKKVVR